MQIKPKYLTCGDNALLVEYGQSISEEINLRVQSLMKCLKKQEYIEILELVPAYASLMIIYNPLLISFSELAARLMNIEAELQCTNDTQWEIIQIPVLYGGEYGPDLGFVAEHNRLTIDEVIRLHSERSYLVYMLGFTPGFPYLGGMDERIAAPRLSQPRSRILEGSVGIADKQTGIYPLESPGGWRVIGRTPLKLFDISREKPILLEAGQRIKFVPIDADAYRRLEP